MSSEVGMLTCVFLGDVVIRREDASSIFRHALEFTKGSDITYCNVEAPICDGTSKNPVKASGSGLHLHSPPNAVEGLLSAGINLVSLANNHMMDFGSEGLTQTMSALRDADILFSGAGNNRDDAHRAAIFEKNGVKVALLSYTSVFLAGYAASNDAAGVATVKINSHYEPNPRTFSNPGSPMYCRTVGAPDDVDRIKSEIAAAKQVSDVVIVAWHWGVAERLGITPEYQRTLSKVAIDAGADAIVGNHAHMLLGVEFYSGKPIFHALGNFAFDKQHPYFRPETIIVRCDITKNGLQNIEAVPVMISSANEPIPVSPSSSEGQKIRWMLEFFSEGLNSSLVEGADSFVLRQGNDEAVDTTKAESLARLGYSEAQINELKAAGAVT